MLKEAIFRRINVGVGSLVAQQTILHVRRVPLRRVRPAVWLRAGAQTAYAKAARCCDRRLPLGADPLGPKPGIQKEIIPGSSSAAHNSDGGGQCERRHANSVGGLWGYLLKRP
jgi:hypothetical protein